jgi:protein O-GlcNAc transferase
VKTGKHIVFWLGRAPEPWDHHAAIEQGIGGSELAALRLTSELAKLGYKISVYADIISVDSNDRNPRWFPYEHDSFPKALLSCDLLVSSRCPTLGLGAMDRKKLGKPTWLWMHDLHVGADWGNTLGTCFDKVICLSKFAKKRFCQYYPLVPSSRVDIIPNGITPELYALPPGESFEDKHKRLQAGSEPLSVIWSSCPDRGLDRALDVWPLIVKAFPGAKLSIFGDFYNWARRSRHFGTPEQGSFAHRLTRMLSEVTGDPNLGVLYFGQAGQSVLAKAFKDAHLWFYPTSFEETSCITALEAQVSGTKIVCSPVGALPETAPAARFVPPWDGTDRWKFASLETIKGALKFDGGLNAAMEIAKALCRSWAEVAELWNIQIDEISTPGET